MVKIKATYTIHRRDDPTGVRVARICDMFKSLGVKVSLVRMKTKYKIEVYEVTSLMWLQTALEEDGGRKWQA